MFINYVISVFDLSVLQDVCLIHAVVPIPYLFLGLPF